MSEDRRRLGAAAVGLFLLLATAYVFSVGLPASKSAALTGDEPFYLLTTQSLIQDGNLDLREQYERESYLAFFDHPDGLWKQSRPAIGEPILSPHSPGLSVLLIPGFAIGELRGAQVEMLLLAAATFAMAFILAALETGRLRLAWLLTAAVGLSAPAFVYSTEIYPEIPAAALLLAAVLAMRGMKGVLGAIALAACLSALAWLGAKYIPVGAVVGSFYVLQSSGRERAWFGALTGLGAAGYIAGHLALFGALTPYNGNTLYGGASTAAIVDSHFAFADRIYRLWGLFVDRRFGIGHWAPLLLLVIPGLPLLFSNRVGRLVAVLVSTQLVVATFFAVTMMGWWFPGRQLIVVFPLFPLALTQMVHRLPTRLAPAWVALAAWSVLITAGLAFAGHRGEVRIAVDPFELRSLVFALPGAVFPDYRWWGAGTQFLSAAWLGLFLAFLAGTTFEACKGGASRGLRQRVLQIRKTSGAARRAGTKGALANG